MGYLKMEEDLRSKDIEFLNQNNVESFGYIWEEALHNHSIHNIDDNQSHWHLSRMSYLAGFLKAKGLSDSNIEKKLNDYYEEIKNVK